MLEAPGFALSVALASAYAAVFYLWRGRRLRDLFFFWLASAVGFAAGQVAGADAQYHTLDNRPSARYRSDARQPSPC